MATGSAPRLRICFFNRSYHPDQGATGQLLTDLAEDLARDGRHEVWVVAGPPLLRSAPLGSAPRRLGGRARARRALPVRARGTKRRADPARVGHRAPAGALRRARGELPELLRLVLSGRARGAPARRGRRADRSADHRPGRARVRPPHRRALRLRLPGRVSRGGAPPRRLPERAGRSAARARHAPAHRPRGPRRGGGRDDARAARGRQGRRSRARHGHPQLGGLLGHRPRTEAQSVVARPRPGRAVRRHALRAISASPRISTSSSMPPRGSPPIPTSSSPSSATG